MSFRRVPREIDPRRPPKRRARDDGDTSEPRSYGQYVDTSRDDVEEIEEFEEVTDEVAREGDEPEAAEGDSGKRGAVRDTESREEFEELAGEPIREEKAD